MILPAGGGGGLSLPLSAPQRTDNSQHNYNGIILCCQQEEESLVGKAAACHVMPVC